MKDSKMKEQIRKDIEKQPYGKVALLMEDYLEEVGLVDDYFKWLDRRLLLVSWWEARERYFTNLLYWQYSFPVHDHVRMYRMFHTLFLIYNGLAN